MTFIWTAPDPLNNTAKTRSIYVTELQNAVNVKRVEISLPPISFIDQSIGRRFRLDAIEELKTVTNDLAILYGYPTGVENPSLLGRPYVTITKRYGKTVCHYPILNDLRVVLNALVVQIGVVLSGIVEHPINGFNNVTVHDIDNFTMPIDSEYKPIFGGVSVGEHSIVTDGIYIYRSYGHALLTGFLYKETRSGVIVDFTSDTNYHIIDMCVDIDYLWVLSVNINTGVYAIFKKRKDNLNNIQIYLNTVEATAMTCDRDYIYLNAVHIDVGWRQAKIVRYDKSGDFSTYFENLIDANLVTFPPPIGLEVTTSIGDISIDENYIYGTYQEYNNQPLGANKQEAFCVVRINKNTLSVFDTLDTFVGPVGTTYGYQYYDGAGITVSNNYVYTFPYDTLGFPCRMNVLNKSGNVLFRESQIDGRNIRNVASIDFVRRLTNREEYGSVL